MRDPVPANRAHKKNVEAGVMPITPTLRMRSLLRAVDVPLSWEEQRLYFQFS